MCPSTPQRVAILKKMFYLFLIDHQRHSLLHWEGSLFAFHVTIKASQVALVVKNPLANAGRQKRLGFDPGVGKIPWRRAQQPILLFLLGEIHGQRSLEKSMDRGAWRATVHRVTKSWTRQKWLHTHMQEYLLVMMHQSTQVGTVTQDFSNCLYVFPCRAADGHSFRDQAEDLTEIHQSPHQLLLTRQSQGALGHWNRTFAE